MWKLSNSYISMVAICSKIKKNSLCALRAIQLTNDFPCNHENECKILRSLMTSIRDN